MKKFISLLIVFCLVISFVGVSLASASGNDIIYSGGITKIEVHWNYADIWLSSSAMRNLVLGETGTIIALIASIPGIGQLGAAAIGGGGGAIAAAIICDQKYPCGVLRVNYAGLLSKQIGVACQTANGGHTTFITVRLPN